jgi:hypothetical protein
LDLLGKRTVLRDPSDSRVEIRDWIIAICGRFGRSTVDADSNSDRDARRCQAPESLRITKAHRAKRVFVRSARMLQPAGADVGTRRVAEVFLVATELDEQRREGMDEHRRFISTVIFAFHWD